MASPSIPLRKFDRLGCYRHPDSAGRADRRLAFSRHCERAAVALGPRPSACESRGTTVPQSSGGPFSADVTIMSVRAAFSQSQTAGRLLAAPQPIRLQNVGGEGQLNSQHLQLANTTMNCVQHRVNAAAGVLAVLDGDSCHASR